MIRVLTVRQPWAWAIVHGGKDVENRSRNVAKADGPGPIAIHVSTTDDANAFVYAARPSRDVLNRAGDAAERGGGSPAYWRGQGLIIGVVDLLRVHTDEQCRARTTDTACSPWADRDRVHLVLGNPRALETPIPVKGALHLQTAPEGVEAEIVRQIGALA